MKTTRRTEITVEKQTSIRITRETAGCCPFCGSFVPAKPPSAPDAPFAAAPEEKK